jgi:cytochrome c5
MKYVFVSVIIISLSVAACKESVKNKTEVNPKDSIKAESQAKIEENNIWVEYDYDQRRGKRLFDHYCVICHGTKGEGDGFNSYNLIPKPHSLADSVYIKKLSDDALYRIISYGGSSMNKSNEMPAYGNTLGKNQIKWIIDYIKTLKD